MAQVSTGSGLISMKVSCSAPAAATARANRTGAGCRTQWEASKRAVPSRPPVVTNTGMAGGWGSGRRVRCAARQHRSMIEWCEATSTSTRRASRSLAATTRPPRRPSLGRPGDHDLPRGGLHGDADVRVVGQEFLGVVGADLEERHRAPPGEPGTSASTGSR